MKESLVKMDKRGTGRVHISDFYGEALKTEWRFGESEAYLRQLGALDESSRWHGKQVIIPNYLQAASNCIVASPHYNVCCANECEALMGEIEAAIKEPVATPERLLAVVGNLTSPSNEDEPLKLGGTLAGQLRQIAGNHGGQVPLHGRLFAQWLHYVFPRECPFPHMTGTTVALTPLQFDGEYIATKEQMKLHVDAASYGKDEAMERKTPPEEAHWMSQWSHEEELLTDYMGKLRAPWEARHGLLGALGLAVGAAALWFSLTMKRDSGGSILPTSHGGKVHMV